MMQKVILLQSAYQDDGFKFIYEEQKFLVFIFTLNFYIFVHNFLLDFSIALILHTVINYIEFVTR